MRADNGIGSLAGGVIDLLCEVTQVGGVECSGDGGRDQALHQDVDTENVHAIRDEGVVYAHSWTDVVCSVYTGNVASTKFGTALIDAEKLQLGYALGDLGNWGRESNRGRACYQEKGRETHDQRVRRIGKAKKNS